MKKLLLFILLTNLFASYDPMSGQKTDSHSNTLYFAKLQMNNHSRVYTNIYSLFYDYKNYGIKNIQVSDYKTKKKIAFEKAFFVYKSNIKPTYGRYSLLAFQREQDALLHVKNFHGQIINAQKVLQIAKDRLKSEEKFMLKRYKKRAIPMGAKIYKRVCPENLDMTEFIEFADFKDFLEEYEPCGKLDNEHFEALSLFMWYKKRKGDLGEVEGAVEVSDDEKCPVCGMFVYKYPKWAAQIFYKHEEHEHHFSFDGVKDLMKFYFAPLKWGKYDKSKQENITQILVTDYYSGKAIDGRKAFYVIGSDIYGPMGHELIPFENLEEAQNFKNEHRGVKILEFLEIEELLPYNLDSGIFN